MITLANNKRLVILSAEQADQTAAFNASRSEYLRGELASQLAAGSIDSVLTCNGQYKGVPERSYLVVCDMLHVERLQALAEQLQQECVLVGVPVGTGWVTGFLRFPGNAEDINIGSLTLCVPGRDYEASTEIHGTSISFCFE